MLTYSHSKYKLIGTTVHDYLGKGTFQLKHFVGTKIICPKPLGQVTCMSAVIGELLHYTYLFKDVGCQEPWQTLARVALLGADVTSLQPSLSFENVGLV